MYHNLTEAARRVVDQLSRRQFIGWLGKGGVALAGALGFDKLCGGAYASQVPCAPPSVTTLLKGNTVPFFFCGKCDVADITFKPTLLCAFVANCVGNCTPPAKCSASGPASLDNVHIHCRPGTRAEALAFGCVNGDVCLCEARVRGGFPKGTITCRCACS